MLVPFVIDPECLDSEPGWPPSQALGYHESMLDIWEKIGLLLHSEEKFDGSSLHRAIEALPQKYRLRWQIALKNFPMHESRSHWTGSIDRKNLGEVAVSAEVAFVDNTRAEAEFDFSVDELSKSSCLSTAAEVCRFTAAPHSEVIKTAQNRALSPILIKEPYEEIWKERFYRLAVAPLKRIFIVDRFALSEHFEHHQSMLTGVSGLKRFLRLLDRDSDGARYVTLYSAKVDSLVKRDSGEIQKELRETMANLPKKNIKLLKLNLLPNSAFAKPAHDRYIRFEKYVWDLGHGLKVFEGPYAQVHSKASFKTGKFIDEYRDGESSLDDHPKCEHFEFQS